MVLIKGWFWDPVGQQLWNDLWLLRTDLRGASGATNAGPAKICILYMHLAFNTFLFFDILDQIHLSDEVKRSHQFQLQKFLLCYPTLVFESVAMLPERHQSEMPLGITRECPEIEDQPYRAWAWPHRRIQKSSVVDASQLLPFSWFFFEAARQVNFERLDEKGCRCFWPAEALDYSRFDGIAVISAELQ